MQITYFDNNSATQLDPRVLEAMVPFLKENYGNPQNMHSVGAVAKDALDIARKSVADFIGAKVGEIYFVSCGSEANNFAIKGVADANAHKGKHIIVSAIEHFSVLYAARRLEKIGFEVTILPVNQLGEVNSNDLKVALRKDTILVSIQTANTEIGTIQNIKELVLLTKANGSLFHTDAVCVAGLIPIDVNDLGVDLLSFSASQFHGPKGAAALYVKKGTRVTPQIDGGVQEEGRRAGLENIPSIVGFGVACELAKNEMIKNSASIKELRDKLIEELPKKVEYVYLNGHTSNRMPNNVNFSIEFIEGEAMMLLLDSKGFMVSSGSACASKALKMSHVLTAIGADPAVGQGSLLIALSKYNTMADVDRFLLEFPAIVKRLREMSPLYDHFIKTGERQVAGPGTDYGHEHDHNHNEE
ncbi:MAG: cysteine desulfurase [Endomicrobiales bacterium]|nr:cysteine desulfurase [Endomicrobiales bacterium]